MALLIVIPLINANSLNDRLNKLAPYNWADDRNIYALPIDESHGRQRNAERIAAYCQDHVIESILIPQRMHCGEAILRSAGYQTISGPSIDNLLRGDGLKKQLRSLQLDWRSAAAARLNHYALGIINEQRVDHWLRQFERLGNHRHVGEHLLQLVDVLPLASLGDALSTDADFYGTDLVVGFNKDKWGKSWGTVSNLIAKKCPTAQLLPINEAVEAGEHPRVLRLVEDGLFTGTEIRGILDSLRGTRGEGRSEKVPRLADPALLARVNTHLQFGVVCDYGEAAVRQYATENGLPNIHVTISSAARTFRVLLSAGTAEPHPSAISFRAQLRTRVNPYAFQNDKGWRDPRALQRAREFCQEIGDQLWRNYLARKAYTGSRWPDERIRICGLGMEGLGLTFAFPHSVPRATLPVFWASGPVVWEGETFEWQPLFPSANS